MKAISFPGVFRLGLLLLGLAVWLPLPCPAAATGGSRQISFLSVWAADSDNARIILELTDEFLKTHPKLSIKIETVTLNNLQSRIKLLRAAGKLPDIFAYPSGAPLNELTDAGLVLDIAEFLKVQGIPDCLDVGAVHLIERLSAGRGVYALPLGMNIEGIWYNKRLFANLQLAIPQTWDELETVCKALDKRGVQPFAVGGKDRWPLSRLVNMYILRRSGINALEAALARHESLTRPDFLEAAQTLQAMSAKGWFGKDPLALDYPASVKSFLEGQAAMLHNGSWFTQDLNDPQKNRLGPEGVGFFNIPLVKGGKGLIDEYSMNCGTVLAVSEDNYDQELGSWLKYLCSRLGDYSLQKYGAYKGYRISALPAAASSYTKLVSAELAKVKKAGLWFEADLDADSAQVALDGVQALFVGAISPQEWLARITRAVDTRK